MAEFKRKRLLVDWRVQGALALRCVIYWCLCLVSISIMLVVWAMLTDPTRFFYEHAADLESTFTPAAIASVFLLPIVIFDLLKLTNRFAGPIYRLRAEMRELARGGEIKRLRFRDGDLLPELAEEFNAMLARFESELRLNQPSANPREFTRAPVTADIEH